MYVCLYIYIYNIPMFVLIYFAVTVKNSIIELIKCVPSHKLLQISAIAKYENMNNMLFWLRQLKQLQVST